MKPTKYTLILIFIGLYTLAFAQKVKVPADFRMEYKYDASAQMFKENLMLFVGNGTYKATEQGKEYNVKITSKEKDDIQKLYSDLNAIGFFMLGLPEADDASAKNTSKMVFITASANRYFLNESNIAGMDAKKAEIAKKGFALIEAFTKELRKK